MAKKLWERADRTETTLALSGRAMDWAKWLWDWGKGWILPLLGGGGVTFTWSHIGVAAVYSLPVAIIIAAVLRIWWLSERRMASATGNRFGRATITQGPPAATGLAEIHKGLAQVAARLDAMDARIGTLADLVSGSTRTPCAILRTGPGSRSSAATRAAGRRSASRISL